MPRPSPLVWRNCANFVSYNAKAGRWYTKRDGKDEPQFEVTDMTAVFDMPGGPMDPATALPVQIYMWAGSPERGFVEKTSAGIMVLLVLLLAMNAVAIYLRKKFERRW